MIEKFTSDELQEIISELKSNGYVVDNTTKACVLDKAKKAAGISGYICQDVKKPLYELVDYLTNNYTVKESKSGGAPRTFKNHHIPDTIIDTYVEILAQVLGALKPYIERRYK